MARIGFGIDNVIGSVVVGNCSGASPDAPATNVDSDQPGIVMSHLPTPDGGGFDVSATTSWIDTDLGSARVLAGHYATATALAAAITSALQLVSALLDCYVSASGNFTIRVSSGTVNLLWSSGAHAGSTVGEEIGFSVAADLTGLAAYTGTSRRWSTHTVVTCDAGSAVSPTCLAAILDGDDDTTYTDVVAYGFSYLPAPSQMTRVALAAGAAVTASFAARGSFDENTTQIAKPSGSARYWILSWRHLDQGREHSVGIFRGFVMASSSTRTVKALSGHELVRDGDSMGPRNYHPAPVSPYWRLSVVADRWEEADYRTVFHALARRGRQGGVLVCVRWKGTDGLESGSASAGTEADNGLLLWGAVADGPSDDYHGQGAGFITGSVTIEQLR